jgi:hypothetical protein
MRVCTHAGLWPIKQTSRHAATAAARAGLTLPSAYTSSTVAGCHWLKTGNVLMKSDYWYWKAHASKESR